MNRTEEKLIKKQVRKKRARCMAILLMCFVFFMSMIYVTDIKTSEMMVKKDGRHAVFLDIENKTQMRIDIAGETFKFNIEYLVYAINTMVKWFAETFNRIMNIMGS